MGRVSSKRQGILSGRVLWPLFILLISSLFSLQTQASPASGLAETSITTLINQRLSYMKAVAAYKWIHQRPIEDTTREKVVINAAVKEGLRYGITMESSEQFFALQIEAAKEIQQYWFTHWQTHPSDAPATAPDLTKDIRPALISLGNRISQGLARPRQSEGQISIEGLSSDSAQQLSAAINAISYYPDQLTQVLESGQLRVGTTGDYAPFSADTGHETNHGATYKGIDIDLARDLAESLDAKLVLVKTSWPTLMDDLAGGAFDIGMSGISINLNRQRTAFFSHPYHTGGKTPISRCDQASEFNTLDRIDTPKTTVIVNPGGTNQRFIDAHIRRANIVVHPDNRTIFDKIVSGQADVMITDAIEVRLQANLNKDLCPTMPGHTLTFQQKAYLLPRDNIWKTYVDTWLAQRLGDGTISETFEKHLNLQAH